ncbi:unnamed protein product [Sphenostylis stenocarpa]|uniref:Uncharacterized protein n=1 Tax=Sphenostylis stenocarpa TaxID=92480 RepID=A0AA86VS96_9FABA|nr:unnamed protein product [Sphenostylis stenocarpa]
MHSWVVINNKGQNRCPEAHADGAMVDSDGSIETDLLSAFLFSEFRGCGGVGCSGRREEFCGICISASYLVAFEIAGIPDNCDRCGNCGHSKHHEVAAKIIAANPFFENLDFNGDIVDIADAIGTGLFVLR